MNVFTNLSIKNKLILIVLLISVLAIVIGFTIMAFQDINSFEIDLVNSTIMAADLVGDFCALGITLYREDEVEKDLERLKIMEVVENGWVYNDSGELFAKYNRNLEDFEPLTAEMENKYFVIFKGNSLHCFRPIIEEGRRVGSIYLRSTTEILDRKIKNYLLTMVLVVIGLIILSYILAMKLQQFISKPILNLAEVTGDISRSADYSLRVKKKGEDEIGILYDGFNDMLEQIQLREGERDEAEAAKEHLFGELQEKNKELEQVVYVTSHDLRSPLVNIQGFSRELEYSLNELGAIFDDCQLSPESREKLDMILKEDIPDSLKFIMTSSSKMDSLLAGLLKLSRVGRAEVTFNPIDVNALINEVLQSFEFQIKELGARVKVEELPGCYGNAMQINQAFSNLVNNALKYSLAERHPLITITGHIKGENVVYCVHDNGIGISKEHQKNIFEIFHRLNPNDSTGEGLGLTIVNKIISRHNGKVWVESKPGVGSKFFVRLKAVHH